MSNVNEVENENLNEEVVEETQEVTVVEKKKFNPGPKTKKALKIAGVAGLGLVGFLLGMKWGSRNNSDDDVEDVEYEIVDDDE